LGPLPYQGSAL